MNVPSLVVITKSLLSKYRQLGGVVVPRQANVLGVKSSDPLESLFLAMTSGFFSFVSTAFCAIVCLF